MINTFKLKVPRFMVWKWGFWFRICGMGPWVAIDDGMPLLFSERYGYVNVWRFWGLKIKWLN